MRGELSRIFARPPSTCFGLACPRSCCSRLEALAEPARDELLLVVEDRAVAHSVVLQGLRECALSLEHLLCNPDPALLVAQLLERARVLVAPGPEAISLTVHRRHIGFARE